jgi:hypothetical protein
LALRSIASHPAARALMCTPDYNGRDSVDVIIKTMTCSTNDPSVQENGSATLVDILSGAYDTSALLERMGTSGVDVILKAIKRYGEGCDTAGNGSRSEFNPIVLKFCFMVLSLLAKARRDFRAHISAAKSPGLSDILAAMTETLKLAGDAGAETILHGWRLLANLSLTGAVRSKPVLSSELLDMSKDSETRFVGNEGIAHWTKRALSSFLDSSSPAAPPLAPAVTASSPDSTVSFSLYLILHLVFVHLTHFCVTISYCS